jgi:hypothetical protein
MKKAAHNPATPPHGKSHPPSNGGSHRK